jgi:hypothetical protein
VCAACTHNTMLHNVLMHLHNKRQDNLTHHIQITDLCTSNSNRALGTASLMSRGMQQGQQRCQLRLSSSVIRAGQAVCWCAGAGGVRYRLLTLMRRWCPRKPHNCTWAHTQQGKVSNSQHTCMSILGSKVSCLVKHSVSLLGAVHPGTHILAQHVHNAVPHHTVLQTTVGHAPTCRDAGLPDSDVLPVPLKPASGPPAACPSLQIQPHPNTTDAADTQVQMLGQMQGCHAPPRPHPPPLLSTPAVKASHGFGQTSQTWPMHDAVKGTEQGTPQ